MELNEFRHLKIDLNSDGVATILINRPEVLNAANARLHWELGEIWPTVDRDPHVRVTVITGAGRAFSAGAELELVERTASDPLELRRQQRHAAAIVDNMISSIKPIVSAINGVAVGAGLVVGLMADISVMASSARFTDGHAKLGIAAGDHAVLSWPLLCGMAKAKHYLLTADFVDGPEAERLGLVTHCVADDELMPFAHALATRLAKGSQTAAHSTKQALNQWYRFLSPLFHNSLASEMLDLTQDDAREGIAALREKRPPVFPSTLTAFDVDDEL